MNRLKEEVNKALKEQLERVKDELPKPMDYVENTGLTNNMDIALYNQRKDAWNECVDEQRQKLEEMKLLIKNQL